MNFPSRHNRSLSSHSSKPEYSRQQQIDVFGRIAMDEMQYGDFATPKAARLLVNTIDLLAGMKGIETPSGTYLELQKDDNTAMILRHNPENVTDFHDETDTDLGTALVIGVESIKKFRKPKGLSFGRYVVSKTVFVDRAGVAKVQQSLMNGNGRKSAIKRATKTEVDQTQAMIVDTFMSNYGNDLFDGDLSQLAA